MQKIILATTSKVRKIAFEQLGMPFIAEDSNVDEYSGKRPDRPEDLTLFLAKKKAEAVAKNHKEGIVIGFDSVGFFEGKIMEKPKSREEAFDRLKMLSGKRHEYISGVYMIDAKNRKTLSRMKRTKIYMREISDKEIISYLDQCDKSVNRISVYMDVSLGYSSNLFYSSSFITKIEGSLTDLIYAIPSDEVVDMLKEIERC